MYSPLIIWTAKRLTTQQPSQTLYWTSRQEVNYQLRRCLQEPIQDLSKSGVKRRDVSAEIETPKASSCNEAPAEDNKTKRSNA